MIPKHILLSLLPLLPTALAQASGTGTTTRYWDCCKASCAWSGKSTLGYGSSPVTSCDINNNPISDVNAKSFCATSSGTSYMCGSQTPWAVSDTLSYGFAATNIAGGSEASWCCACYKLTFTSGPVAGKQMIVQSTNTGGDLGGNQFDLAVYMKNSCRRDIVSANWCSDSWRWIRHLQCMLKRIWYTIDWMGCPVWRHL